MTNEGERSEEEPEFDPAEFYASGFKPLLDYYSSSMSDVSKQIAEALTFKVDLPSINFNLPTLPNGFATVAAQQFVELNTTIRQAMEPLNEFFKTQWQD